MTANCIWQMKFSTKSVLLAKQKVREGAKTYIYFCADRNYPDLYSISYEDIKKCRLVSNGKIICYDIPVEYLHNEGELSEDLKKEREKQYLKFKKFMKK